ncbi:MAG: hypothetical protein SGCHY_004204 [Lobulomycetales sp.]
MRSWGLLVLLASVYALPAPQTVEERRCCGCLFSVYQSLTRGYGPVSVDEADTTAALPPTLPKGTFAKARHLGQDEECFFCLDELGFAEATDLTFCSLECGISVHVACQKEWERAKGAPVCANCHRKFVPGVISQVPFGAIDLDSDTDSDSDSHAEPAKPKANAKKL